MNKSNYNSSIGININNINSIEFNLNSPNLQNHSTYPRSNCNIANFHSDSSLVRPIPKKVDLSRMIYQQFIDPCARQNQSGIAEMNHVTDNRYAIPNMYHDPMNINNTNNNSSNKFPNQIQNAATPSNDSRAWLNQYLSMNNGNQSVLNENQFYPHPHNMPPRNMSISSADGTSYMFNHMKHQVSLRQNRLNSVSYVSINESEGSTLKEKPKTIINAQYCPIPSVSDGLIENHFTMSLNQNLKFNYNNKCNFKNETKVDPTKNKCAKKQIPNRIEKVSKVIKRSKKSKDSMDYVDNIIQDNSHTPCTTPSDSSISPVSMVSCRSTVTPQTLYPSFTNIGSVVQNCRKTPDKNEINSKTSHQYSDLKIELTSLNAKQKKDDFNNLVHGLPLKKRIKWKVEEENATYSPRSPIKDIPMENGGNDTELSNVNAGKNELHQNEESEKRKFVPLDPLNTFQKTFLPMEKHFMSSETESEEELDCPGRDYRGPQKDNNYVSFFDNNI